MIENKGVRYSCTVKGQELNQDVSKAHEYLLLCQAYQV